ncbi:large ribosomal subunit protein mL38-like [Macrobrachium nipponense]|uniref:large ribosomal subunit protein mL38-like n=1 Tax=Macrobrachium nipponense TaxID=159736 RepID=UPI0030C7EC3E
MHKVELKRTQKTSQLLKGKPDAKVLIMSTMSLELRERTFSTLDFYHELQDEITPAGVAWFQSDWDSTLTNVFHKKLNMREPIYEYDFPPPYITAEKYFPVKKAFQ